MVKRAIATDGGRYYKQVGYQQIRYSQKDLESVKDEDDENNNPEQAPATTR